ncbi:MAG: hypothetical protein ACFCVK_13115 [Acidimicrobiales bacterium]
MTVVAAVTVVALLVILVALGAAVKALTDIGIDADGFGPWRRPPPTRPPTRLPADFVALWSLLGERSLRTYAGSWEAAVRRVDRLEVHLRHRRGPAAGCTPKPSPAPADYSPGWLDSRVDRLEQLAGAHPVGRPDPAAPPFRLDEPA